MAKWQEIQYENDEDARPYFLTPGNNKHYIDEFMKTEQALKYDGVNIHAVKTMTNLLALGVEVSYSGDAIKYVWIGGNNE